MEEVGAAVPVIERADDGYLFRIRRPYREVCAFLSLTNHGMRAKFVVQLNLCPLIEEKDIIISQSTDGRVTRMLRSALLAH